MCSTVSLLHTSTHIRTPIDAMLTGMASPMCLHFAWRRPHVDSLGLVPLVCVVCGSPPRWVEFVRSCLFMPWLGWRPVRWRTTTNSLTSPASLGWCPGVEEPGPFPPVRGEMRGDERGGDRRWGGWGWWGRENLILKMFNFKNVEHKMNRKRKNVMN